MAGGKVIEITSSGDWQKRHNEAKAAGKAVLVDFTATWCGPCKMIAPIFEQLSTTYTNIVFLKVDVDQNQDISMQNGVSAMPTFHMYNNKGQKTDEVRGGNPNALKAWCEQNNKAASFQGTGHTLAGSSAAPASAQAPSSTQQSTGVKDGHPATNLQIRLADGSKLTGRFNLTQTIQDVKRFIDASSSPAFAYKLTTSYPRKELTDLSQTLQAADVADTVLTVQRA